MKDWKNIAKKALGGDSVTAGLEKITVDEIIKAYPDGISLTGVNVVKYTDNKIGEVTFPVFTFAEDATKYFSGGKALREMVDAWIEAADGDLREVNGWLKNDPLKIRMTKIRTKTGNTFTNVQVLDDEPTVDAETGEVLTSDDPF